MNPLILIFLLFFYKFIIIGTVGHNKSPHWGSELEWNLWKNLNRKNYSAEFEKHCYGAWIYNYKQVSIHNTRYAEGKEMYIQNLNKFADRMPYKMRHTLLRPVPTWRFYHGMQTVRLSHQDVPDEANWVPKGWVFPYYSRYFCPDGWVFSAVRSVEAQIYNMTGQHLRLSQQEVFDCVEEDPRRSRITLDAFSYIYKLGVTLESVYPLSHPKQDTCKREEHFAVTKIKSYHLLEPYDEENLKLAVALVGPISVSIRVTDSFFFYYKGIYYNPLCIDEKQFMTNHAVLLVGYGTDSSNSDFWIIQNNWGVNWGEYGFARIARNTLGNCGIASAAIYPVADDLIEF